MPPCHFTFTTTYRYRCRTIATRSASGSSHRPCRNSHGWSPDPPRSTHCRRRGTSPCFWRSSWPPHRSLSPPCAPQSKTSWASLYPHLSFVDLPTARQQLLLCWSGSLGKRTTHLGILVRSGRLGLSCGRVSQQKAHWDSQWRLGAKPQDQLTQTGLSPWCAQHVQGLSRRKAGCQVVPRSTCTYPWSLNFRLRLIHPIQYWCIRSHLKILVSFLLDFHHISWWAPD